MSVPVLSVLVASVLATGAVVLSTQSYNPDCPDGPPEGDVDPDHPCFGLTSQARTSTQAPELPMLRPGEPRTFDCMTWGGCAWFYIQTPKEGASRLHVVVEAEMAGGFSPRADMSPGPHFEPMWSDGVYYDGGQRTEWTFEAPFNATRWMLEFTSMWEDAGGPVTVTVDFPSSGSSPAAPSSPPA